MDAENFYEAVAEAMGERILQVTGAAERPPWQPMPGLAQPPPGQPGKGAPPAEPERKKRRATSSTSCSCTTTRSHPHSKEWEGEEWEMHEGSCTSSCYGSTGQRSRRRRCQRRSPQCLQCGRPECMCWNGTRRSMEPVECTAMGPGWVVGEAGLQEILEHGLGSIWVEIHHVLICFLFKVVVIFLHQTLHANPPWGSQRSWTTSRRLQWASGRRWWRMRVILTRSWSSAAWAAFRSLAGKPRVVWAGKPISGKGW